MTDSRSLGLVFSTANVHDALTTYISRILKNEGHEAISPSMLNFLGALDCGVNYGSDIARKLKVSRQMVAKTVKELCRVGYLEQIQAQGKQKQIVFTDSGEALMARVRELLAQLDDVFCKTVGERALSETLSTLEAIQTVMRRELLD